MTPTHTLREKALKATQGPWSSNSEGDIAPASDQGNNGYWVAHLEDCGPNWKANADFIAAANPSTILSLLDEIDRLREALTLARNRLQRCVVDHDTGSLKFIERAEWADEATRSLASGAAK